MSLTPEEIKTYFLNENWVDSIMANGRIENQLKTYQYASRQQTLSANFSNITGLMSDFKVDRSLNIKYNLPSGTYTCTVNEDVIPYYNKKQYMLNGGTYNKAISLLDIASNNKVYSRRVMFNIGNYVFMNLLIVPSVTNKSILAIVIDNSVNGITSSKMKELIASDIKWTLSFSAQSDIYYGHFIKSELFDDKGRIKVSKLRKIVTFPNRAIKINSWTLIITGEYANSNLMYQSTGIMSMDPDLVLTMPDKFREFLYSLSNTFKVYIINNYALSGSMVYEATGKSEPIFEIPFTDKPVAPNNILVYKYDKTTARVLERVDTDCKVYYPNVYDFSAIDSGTDLYLEWYMKPSTTTEDILDFDNNFAEYISYVDSTGDSYANVIVNQLAPEVIRNYTPIMDYKYDYLDYRASGLGNIRKYCHNKYDELINDNPYRYSRDIKKLTEYNKRFTTMSLLITEEVYDILKNRLSTSNADKIVNTSQLISFTKDTTYIEFSNNFAEENSVHMYVNGKKVQPTAVSTNDNISRIYFPMDYIDIDSYITIDVDCYRYGNMTLDNNVQKSAVINFPMTNIDIPIPVDFGIFQFPDVLFYSDTTKEYIDLSMMGFKLTIPNSKIKFSDGTEEIYPSYEGLSKSYLVTSDDKWYLSIDEERYLLAELSTSVDITDMGILDSHVKFDSKYLDAYAKDINMVNDDIIITTTNNYRHMVVDITNSADRTINMLKFKGNPDPSRFRVYHNGVRIYDYTYTAPAEYDGTAVFTISESIQFAEDKNIIEIEYIPYDVTQLATSIIDDKLIEITNSPDRDYVVDIDYMQVYVDGYRIPSYKIHEVPNTINTFIFDDIPITSDTNIVVEYPRTDVLYNATSLKEKNVNNILMHEDSEFVSYLYKISGGLL